MVKEQYGTTTPKINKYMFDANQSLRISLEKLLGMVHVVLQTNLLWRKKQNIRRDDHHRGRKESSIVTLMHVAEKKHPSANDSRVLSFNFRKPSQKDFVTKFSFSSNRKKDHPPLDIPTGRATTTRIT